MKIGDKITIRNQAILNKKLSQFPELIDYVKLGNRYEIIKIWNNAIPEILYGLDSNPDLGFTEDELRMIQLPYLDPNKREEFDRSMTMSRV